MELKLNIYNDNMQEVIKVYTTNTFQLKLGVIEDLLNLIDFDKFNSNDNKELTMSVLKLLPKCLPSVKELLKCIFNGVTDDELRNISVSDLVPLIINIVKYSIGEMSLLKTEKK